MTWIVHYNDQRMWEIDGVNIPGLGFFGFWTDANHHALGPLGPCWYLHTRNLDKETCSLLSKNLGDLKV